MTQELVTTEIRERLEVKLPGRLLRGYDLRGISPESHLAWFKVSYGPGEDWVYIQVSPRFAVIEEILGRR